LLIALDKNVDPKVAELLSRIDGVELKVNAPRSAIITADDALPVEIELLSVGQLEVPPPISHDETARFVVANAVLDDETAARLEDAGVSYIDAGGRSWLRGEMRSKQVRRQPETTRRSLYPASVRLAQLLADHPGEPWTQRHLADRGHTTQLTAQRLLLRLESERLMERRGKGRGTTRWVTDAVRLRAWLSREARPRRVFSLPCYVDDPGDLPSFPGRGIAITGAHAARRLGFSVMTGREAMAMARVNVADDELDEIPAALGGFRTENGANLLLIADPDRLAFTDPLPAKDGSAPLAPPSRIMLDLFLEPRGEAAVGVFLDLWGERELAG
jgi:hypothetical protein